MTPTIPPLRVGLGYDLHRLGNGGPLLIGGVEIPADVHSIGHSDADVLLHAITDALLGAVAEQDIGRLFPDDDPQNRGRDSAEFLAEAIRRVRHHGMEIVNGENQPLGGNHVFGDGSGRWVDFSEMNRLQSWSGARPNWYFQEILADYVPPG